MAGLVGQVYFGGSFYDSSRGMSFGIYALFGVVAILALAISEVTSPAAATAGHITSVSVSRTSFENRLGALGMT